MKIKKIIDGKEVEIEITDTELNKAGFISQTALLEDEELFNEALQMRGVKIDTKKKSIENQTIIELTNLVKGLQDSLNEEKKARAEAIKSLEEKSKKELSKKIEADIQTAVKEGKITPEQKATWQERLSKDYDGYSVILSELPRTTSSEASKASILPAGTINASKPDSPIGQKILERNNIINN
ncbi:MAG: hypothetical protein QXF70_03485 [Candidatus Bilamarchaeaceae archaeon]